MEIDEEPQEIHLERLSLDQNPRYLAEKRGMMDFIKKLLSKGLPSFVPVPVAVPLPVSAPKISVITSHGALCCNPDITRKKPTTLHIFKIPEGIEVIKISIAPPGIENYCSSLDSYEYIQLINKYANDLIASNFSEEYLKLLIDGIFIIYNAIVSSLYSSKDVKKTEEELKSRKEFISHNVLGIKIFRLRPGNKIINKTFSRHIHEKDMNDFSVLEISKSESKDYLFPDLFDVTDLVTNIEEQQLMTTENIINHYKNNGVRRLLMIDFSCSTPDYDISVRDTRGIRRDIITKNIPFGGLKKTKKRKMKKRKNKKRKTKKRRTI